MVALGFNLIYGTTKFFHMAHGAVITVAVFGAYLAVEAGAPWLFSFPTAAILAGALGWGLETAIYRPLRKRGASSLVLLVASLATLILLQNLLALAFGSQTRVIPGTPLGQRGYDLPGVALTPNQVTIILTTAFLTALLVAFLQGTRLGKAVRAVSDDREVAEVVGINVDRVLMVVFVVGSAYAGVAAVLVGGETGIQPTMGMSLLLKAVIASIIGGIGNIYGSVAGGLLLGVTENLGIWKVPAEWKDSIAFAILILFLLFRPQGIFSK